MLWLGRVGKIMAFLAGCTIVLDIIGSEKLMAWSQRTGERDRFRDRFILFTGALVTIVAAIGQTVLLLRGNATLSVPGALGALCAILCAYLLGRYNGRIAGWIAGALARQGVEVWVRWVALPLFFVGFALDYLAS